ncbi:MAG: hypothetical protein ACFE8E_02125 [Candidatus Hodarchaeota archaeon]
MEVKDKIQSLTKKFNFDKLKFLIENSQDENLRIKSAQYIKNLGLNDSKVFQFLEDLLISDSNIKIRKIAFESLISIDAKKVVKTIIYAINYESGTFLIDLIEFLYRINPFICKQSLKKKIQQIEKKNPKILLKNQKLDKLGLSELKEILYNHQLNNSLEFLYFHRRSIPLALDLYGME